MPLAGAHAGTLAGAHAGTLTGTLAGTRNWSGCSSNCWAVTTTPQIWEAGRPRPQEKGVTGTFAGTFTGRHIYWDKKKLGILTHSNTFPLVKHHVALCFTCSSPSRPWLYTPPLA